MLTVLQPRKTSVEAYSRRIISSPLSWASKVSKPTCVDFLVLFRQSVLMLGLFSDGLMQFVSILRRIPKRGVSIYFPCRCLCFGFFEQIMYTRFFLRTGLHASQSRLTDERVFIPRVCEDVRRESGEREVASVEDGEEKRKRTAARNMVVIARE